MITDSPNDKKLKEIEVLINEILQLQAAIEENVSKIEIIKIKAEHAKDKLGQRLEVARGKLRLLIFNTLQQLEGLERKNAQTK